MSNGTVIILRGIPGSGKSTIAELIACDDNDAIISMDQYWELDGQYRFDPNRIKEAAHWTREQYLNAINSQTELIVVDNTHTKVWEMKFFIEQAQRNDYTVHILHVERDIYESFRDGRHNLPWHKMVNMADRWEPIIDRSTPEKRLARLEMEHAQRVVNDLPRRTRGEK